MTQPRISIIIPAYNEAENISDLIANLRHAGGQEVAEIIVSDGGSTDETIRLAAAAGACVVFSPIKGRAGQMNHGVALSGGDILYFVHADTRPPKSFAMDIRESVEKGYDCGSFRFRFDRHQGLLRLNAFFTRFNYLFFRGGDQNIFVTRSLWEKTGPYNAAMRIMEDYDFLARLWRQGRFRLIQKDTVVSARKYDQNSWLQVQLANLKVVRMWRRGAAQEDMIAAYHKALNYRPNAF